jgi:hypothetical protein
MFRINAFDVNVINEKIHLIFMNAAIVICFLIHVIFFTSRKYDDCIMFSSSKIIHSVLYLSQFIIHIIFSSIFKSRHSSTLFFEKAFRWWSHACFFFRFSFQITKLWYFFFVSITCIFFDLCRYFKEFCSINFKWFHKSKKIHRQQIISLNTMLFCCNWYAYDVVMIEIVRIEHFTNRTIQLLELFSDDANSKKLLTQCILDCFVFSFFSFFLNLIFLINSINR